MDNNFTDVANNLINVKQKIREHELKYHRQPGSVSLLAVSKKQSLEKIQTAIDAGQLAFGENYLQEALPKIAVLADRNLEWHFIGAIQSNKIKKIAEAFHWVHTVSDIKTAERLNAHRLHHLPPLNICIQINIDEEATKSGISPSDAFELAQFCSQQTRLVLRGLMAIPELKNNLAEQRAVFHKLANIYQDFKEKGFNFDTLSMGMSDDLEAAIAEGSTLVRIGTAIFGKRI